MRVDAAATGGREGEAVLNAVCSAEGARLRAVLLREAALVEHEHEHVPVEPTAPVPAQPRVPPPAVVLARFDPRWLLYAPLVGGYLLAPLAAIGALANYAGELRSAAAAMGRGRARQRARGAGIVVGGRGRARRGRRRSSPPRWPAGVR